MSANELRGVMHRLSVTVFCLIAPTLAGVGLVIGLLSSLSRAAELAVCAGAGVIVAGPASWGVMRALVGTGKTGE